MGPQLMDAILATITGGYNRLSARIDSHDARLKAVEDRPASLKYAGVWAPQDYSADSAVTLNGSLWIARRDCGPGDRPGNGALAWQLAVKSGAPGGARP